MTGEQLARLLGDGWALEREAPGGALNLADRLALRLRHLIDGDLLPAGTQLPAERTLALALSVSRPTVSAALSELGRRELVRSRQGSGTWVAERRQPPDWVPGMAETVIDVQGINLAAAVPADSSHLGRLEVRLADLLSATPAHGISPVGLPALRARLAAHHTARGLPTQSEQIIVTNAAQHALSIALATFASPGDAVVVEQHTYGGLLDLLDVHRMVPSAIARDADGPRPDALDRALRSGAQVVYLTPTVHAPTGARTAPARQRELAAVLDRHDAVVIADDTLADLAFTDAASAPLAALCTRARVLTVGSLSKSVWGGLRIGWLRADAELVRALVRVRTRSDLGSAVAAQQVALKVLEQLDALLERRVPDLRGRAAHLRCRLGDALPDWEITEPGGGLALWARVPGDDAAPFVATAARRGVAVMPGTVANARRPTADAHVRLCFDREPGILDAAVARLARV